MGSTIVQTGEKIVCDDTKKVFVHGSHNLGCVLSKSVCGEANHPGEGLEHTAGASGEDSVTLHVVRSARGCGISEVDFGMIDDCTKDYTVTVDLQPWISYNMNAGAWLRNIVFVDPTAIVNADQCALISPGTAGSFIPLIEVALKDSVTGTPEAFNDAAVIGDAAATFAGRTPLRVAYGIADPGAAVDLVCYISTF